MKYHVTKDKIQDGGYIPFKVMYNVIPRPIGVAPVNMVIRTIPVIPYFTPMSPIISVSNLRAQNSPIVIKVRSQKINFDLALPFVITRQFVDNIYLYRSMEPLDMTRDAYITIIAPNFTTSTMISYRTLQRILIDIQNNPSISVRFTDPMGTNIPLTTIIQNLNNYVK